MLDADDPPPVPSPDVDAALRGAPRPFFVGIGSSAGGLEALSALLPGLPAGLGLCFVVVQHMSPTHRSMLAQLLGRIATLEVLEVTDGCLPLADHVYVTPPNCNVVLADDGRLRLEAPPNETVPKPSVNLFFNSLAESVGDRAIGVVLSGTGSDGTVGLHAIKAAGGYAFAQDPGGARYDGMVRAAIEAGGVDWVLPAEAIGPEIRRIVLRQLAAEAGQPVDAVPPATLQALLHSLYAHTRIDFTGYKEATLLRRIERRMTSTGCLTLDQYLDHTHGHPRELQNLAQDMLISVTSFFRDRLAFDRLRDELVRMLENKPSGEEVRVWVAGCASGEEAYSVAILLHDLLAGQPRPHRVQIFASDIDDQALARARRGVYPAGVLSDIEPSMLERHFTRHADGYEVNKALRGMVMFASHNLVQDPPFARLDLVACRNVLIYLQPALQQRLMRTFQYALNPAGLLFLGRSEGVHGAEAVFETIDRAAHLFRRGPGARTLPLREHEQDRPRTRARAARASLDERVQRATATRFLPASVVVDGSGEIRHFHGDLAGVMTLPEGRPGYQLMSLLRRELRPELARLMRLAGPTAHAEPDAPRRPADAEPVLGRWASHPGISAEWGLRLSVQRLGDDTGAPMTLVCFERRPLGELPGTSVGVPVDAAAASLAGSALEEELAATREHLYTVIEELETSNEESQSLNEEIQTANEELQATNEELEASNEELQASNEELTTVNEELQVKSLEWQALSAELESIYAAVDSPLMACDRGLVLTRVNQAANRQLGLDPGWLGRSVQDLPWPEGTRPTLAELEQVQARGVSEARQLGDASGRHWSLRIMPRIGLDGSRQGVLIQMEDVTRLHESEEAAHRSDAQLRQLVARSMQLVCICDPGGRLQMANPEFERHHGLAVGSAAGRLLDDVLPPPRAQAFQAARLEAMRVGAPVEVEEVMELAGMRRELLASYYPLQDDDGGVSGVCYQAVDITQRNQAEAALLVAQSAKLAAEGMARTKSDFLANMSHEIRTPMNAVLGLSRMALAEDLPAVARGYVGKVHEAAQALTRILDDVLDFSRIEAGELRFERRPFRLAGVLSDVMHLFAANAQEKALLLAMDEPLGVPTHFLGDALRLSQVLNNLVGNAIKFTERGEVRVSVRTEGPADGDAVLRFAVRDSGIGIEPAVRDGLFQAFTQGDATVTRRFGGTGLGLAICRRLVEMMGGQIGVVSEPGRGSEFWFTVRLDVADGLDDMPRPGEDGETAPAWAGETGNSRPDAPAVPVVAAPRLGEPAPAEVEARQAFASLYGAGPVLLAEDNVLNQIVGQAVLEGVGLAVEIVNNGAEALALLAAHPVGHFKAIFMDMHMPVMDGLEATRRLRTLPEGQGLPVFAITAAALSEDRERCLAAGMDAHIAKPLDPQDLIAAMARFAGTPRGGGTLTAGAPTHPLADSEDPLPAVTGFDLQPLLERVQDNRRMVWRLLEEFVAREGQTAEEIRELVANQRLEDARVRAHTLVGSAIAVGATLVARTAAGLESALRAGVASPSMLQSVDEALRMNLSSAKEALRTKA